jgi:hypothetical protein
MEFNVSPSYPADSRHTYIQRLLVLARRHRIEAVRLKALIEDAFGTPTCIPDEKESEHALRHLARLKVKVRELNWLFGYNVIPETRRVK